MKPYSEESKCPKCGHDKATSRYETFGEPPFIERGCRTCGFQWSELPLDARNPQEGAEEPPPICPQCNWTTLHLVCAKCGCPADPNPEHGAVTAEAEVSAPSQDKQVCPTCGHTPLPDGSLIPLPRGQQP